MASPVYSAGTPGNLISNVSVAHGVTAAAFLDLSTSFEGQLTVETIVGASVPTALATWSVYKAYAAGASAPITLTASAAAAATSLSTSSKTGLSKGQVVCIQQAGGSKLGELITVTNITGASSPFTLTVSGAGSGSGLVNSYSSSDNVYLMAQTATFAVQPSSPGAGYSANGDYSDFIDLGPGQWIVAANNGDGSVSVTANATYDKLTGVA